MSGPQAAPGSVVSTHRYSRPALLADGGRALLGLSLTLGPLVLLDTAAPVAWLLAALAALFAWFGARTLIRQKSSVLLSAEGIDLVGPRPASIRWAEVDQVRLAYFAPRRAQAQQGWLQLTLRERTGRKLRLDSTLEGFSDLLGEVRQVVERADLPLDPTTASNLAALDQPDGRGPVPRS